MAVKYYFRRHRWQWVGVRLAYVYCASVLLMSCLGLSSFTAKVLVESDSFRDALRVFVSLADVAPFLGVIVAIGAITGSAISPIVAILVFRRRPLPTLCIVYAFSTIYITMISWDDSYHVARSAAVSAIAFSSIAALFWSIWDLICGQGFFHDHSSLLSSDPLRCESCGYILYADDVPRCSECGARINAQQQHA